MSLILQPQKAFTVVRQIENHLDSGTYYVQAKIRDAYTDELLETLTLNLTSAQRYKGNWQVCADTSGEGRYVSIVTSVYTDSDFTTKSENYGDEETTYLVQNRVPFGRGAGGGSLGIADVRRVIREELEKQPKSESIDYERIPKPKDFTDRTDEILTAIRENKPEKPEKVNLAPVLEAINQAKQAVEAKEVTPATDLSPLLQKLDEKNETDGLDFSEVKETLAGIEQSIVGKVEETIKSAINDTEFVSTFSTAAKPRAQKKAQEQAEREDINLADLGA
jgi:hypothetical protein